MTLGLVTEEKKDVTIWSLLVGRRSESGENRCAQMGVTD